MAATVFTPARNDLAEQLAEASPCDGVIGIGPVLPDDLSQLFVWLNDAKAASLDMPYSPVDCVAYKSWLDKVADDHSQILFAIRRVADRHCLGFAVFKNFQAVHRAAEFGIRIGAETERGKGYGARATRLALDHAWNTLNLHRVSLTVLAENTRAIACYRRVGFRQEGVLRDAAFIGGRWHDLVTMAALIHQFV